MSDEIRYESAKEMKVGRFILIENVPCKVVDVETSAPGKHGSAKIRITAMGLFDNTKRTMLTPSHADVQVPVINKRRAQVVSITGEVVQVMDTENYETYEIGMNEDLKNTLKPGAEVEVIETMGKRAMTRILGGM